MKKLVLAAAIASGLSGVAATPAFAETSVSANVSLVSDYRFRGVSQSAKDNGNTDDAQPALQGGFDVDFGNGFYIGNWNSNVTFGGASLEMDFYGGYAGEVNGISYDIGTLYYYYPGSSVGQDNNTLEVYGSLGYMGFGLGVAGSVSSDTFFGGEDYLYYSLSYDYSVNDALSIGATYGYTDIDNTSAGDYADWTLGATYTVGSYDFGLTYVDTDISPDNGLTDGTVVFSVGTSF